MVVQQQMLWNNQKSPVSGAQNSSKDDSRLLDNSSPPYLKTEILDEPEEMELHHQQTTNSKHLHLYNHHLNHNDNDDEEEDVDEDDNVPEQKQTCRCFIFIEIYKKYKRPDSV